MHYIKGFDQPINEKILTERDVAKPSVAAATEHGDEDDEHGGEADGGCNADYGPGIDQLQISGV